MTKTPDPAPTGIGTGSGSDREWTDGPPYNSPHPPSQHFRIAVAAACDAYEKSARMLDAALLMPHMAIQCFRSASPARSRSRGVIPIRPVNIQTAFPEPEASTRQPPTHGLSGDGG